MILVLFAFLAVLDAAWDGSLDQCDWEKKKMCCPWGSVCTWKRGGNIRYCLTGMERVVEPEECGLICPKGCNSFYDGCNTCKCDGVGKLGACTKKFCTTKNEPKCLTYGNDADKMCPKDCALWFDGCNNCICTAEGEGACTKKACDFDKFAECLEYKGDKECPEGCAEWFDGCNTCKCDKEGGSPMCTEKACEEWEEAECRKRFDGDVVDNDDVVDDDDEVDDADEVCPFGCEEWFDGCNLCTCDGPDDSNPRTCTKKKCEVKKEAKCFRREVCPRGCAVWHDGCNDCNCEYNGYPCTEDVCHKEEDAYCKEWKPVDICPFNCRTWFDGCNNCECAGDRVGELGECTKKTCSIKMGAKCVVGKSAEELFCPADCKVWFDGCNECQCAGEGKLGSCTKRACSHKAEPKCLEQKICPGNCKVFSDGCNNCQCVEEGKLGSCTGRGCAPRYVKEPECLMRKEEKEKCPADCKLWFDGCNTCRCGEGEGEYGFCTVKFCLDFMKQEPKCLEKEAREVCPADCNVWFDGCNRCQCAGEGKLGFCTRGACENHSPNVRCVEWKERCRRERAKRGCTKWSTCEWDMYTGKCVNKVPEYARMNFESLVEYCTDNMDSELVCKVSCGGKFKKGSCAGWRNAKQVKCKKIKDTGICARIGCSSQVKRDKVICSGKPFEKW